MRFPRPLLQATLLRRYARFFADVRMEDGRVETVHCPNTGSLLGVREPGLTVYLLDSANPARKLRYTWVLARVGRAFVNIETSIPNRVVHDAMVAGAIPELRGYARARREVPYGRSSRIDLLLDGRPGEPPCYVEVKCTTLAEGRVARFPDAVTERGRKHLTELARQARKGARAVQFFFCSRTDADRFHPADDIDPEYGRELRRASRAGVEVLAWRAAIDRRGVDLDKALPVDLGR